jgi:hypothetical protein
VNCVTALNAPAVVATDVTGTLLTANQPNITAIGTQPVADITSLESLNQIILDDLTIISRAELQQLANIDNSTIGASQWGYLAAMSQNVSQLSDVRFKSLMLSANVSNNGTYGLQISDTSETNYNKLSIVWSKPYGGLSAIRLYPNLTTGNLIFSTAIGTGAHTDAFSFNSGGINLNSLNITNGGTITSTSFVGDLTGTATTVTSGTQSAITTLPNLASVQGQSIGTGVWSYVNNLNQNVATSASPSFANINAGSPAATTGNMNAGSAGVYSYNGSSRYIRFNSNGGANDLLSAGAAMVINYNGGSSGVKPENVELFGYHAISPSTLFVNGNLSMGNGVFDTVESTSRTLTVKAGTAQGSGALLNITNNSNVSLFSASQFGIKTNYGTGAGGAGHLTMAKGGADRFVIGMQNDESSGNAGSDFRLFSYTDAGGYLGAPVQIKRSNSAVTLEGPLNLSTTTDNTNGNITAGTWTPTITPLSNVTSAALVSASYQRIGNIVNCAIRYTYRPSVTTALANYEVTITLPINTSSTFSACFNATGAANRLIGFGDYYSTSSIYVNVTSNSASATDFDYSIFVTGQYVLN